MTKLQWLQSKTNNRIKCYGCGKHEYLGVKSNGSGLNWTILCHSFLGGCGTKAYLTKFQRHDADITDIEYIYGFRSGDATYWYYLFQDKTNLFVDGVVLEKPGFKRMQNLAMFL